MTQEQSDREEWKDDFDEATSDTRNTSLQRFISQRAIIETECCIRNSNAPNLTTPCKADLIQYWHDSIERECVNAQIETLKRIKNKAKPFRGRLALDPEDLVEEFNKLKS